VTRGRLAATLAVGLLGDVAAVGAAGAAPRVTDPTIINRFDTRVDVGLATPVGAIGGTISVPWRHVVLDGSLGWGLTGAQLSVMPKVVPFRRGRHAVMLGLAATLAQPTFHSILGRERSFWQTAELAYQRATYIDSIFYVGAGVTRGTVRPRHLDGGGAATADDRVVYWPMVRLGWGMRR
jgi:hypothetical protein